jgi:hypothetical protein
MTSRTRYELAARMFVMDASTTGMTVLHDDGLYRHLRFRRPDTGLYWFELVTWPGSLCFHGDVGTWVFSRTTDMATFFGRPGQDINPGYWAEKVQAGETRRYDEDQARAYVQDAFADHLEAHGLAWPLAEVRDLWAEIDRDVLSEIYDEHTFRSAVSSFYHQDGKRRFSFDQTDWDLRGFSAQFLWACFAVQWGVNQYRAHKAAEETPMPVPALPPVPRIHEFVRQQAAMPAPAPAVQAAFPSRTGEVVLTPKEEYL